MVKFLSPKNIKIMSSIYNQLERDGIAIVENFLKPKEVSELLEAGKKLCYDAPKKDRTVFTTAGASSSHTHRDYFLKSGDKIHYFFEAGAVGAGNELLVPQEKSLNKVGHGLHIEHPIFKKYTYSDKVCDILRELNYKKPAVCQSMYIFKNPGVNKEVTSHQDSTFMYTEPTSVIGFWIPLEDVSIENGCLKALKGSHKSGVHRRFIRNPDKTSEELVIYDRPPVEYSIADFTPLPVPKGSLVLIHGQVVHRSEQNTSKGSRQVYTFHVIETKDTKFSEQNWIQPTPEKPFEIFYDE